MACTVAGSAVSRSPVGDAGGGAVGVGTATGAGVVVTVGGGAVVVVVVGEMADTGAGATGELAAPAPMSRAVGRDGNRP